MKLTTTATLSKSLSVKREKVDESEAVIARLKLSDCFVSREEIDWLAGMGSYQKIGWSRAALFDELGAPLARLEIALLRREFAASVRLSGNGNEGEMHVTNGVLSDITLTLAESGALLAATLSWPVAGDEVSDIEALLGQIVRAEMGLTDGEQGDLLKSAA